MEIYRGTPGFLSLITEKKPRDFTPQDLEAYKTLLMQTNALYQNNNPASHRFRASGGKKGKRFKNRFGMVRLLFMVMEFSWIYFNVTRTIDMFAVREHYGR